MIPSALPPKGWESHARAVAVEALNHHGLRAPIYRERILSTGVFLTEEVALKVYPPSVKLRTLVATNKVAKRLARNGAPVLTPLYKPRVHQGAVVALYPLGEPYRGSEYDRGVALRRLHDAATPRVLEGERTPRWSPLSRVDGAVSAYLRAGGSPQVGGAVLVQRLRLLTQLEHSCPSLPPAIIHCDTSVANMVTHQGTHVFIDLDLLASGPREYDLAPTALAHERGEMAPSEYAAFTAGYGLDPSPLPMIPLLRVIIELGTLAFVLWSEAQAGSDLSFAPQMVEQYLQVPF